MDQWVAVAYDDDFYVRKITLLSSEDEINVNFISKVKFGTYKWPKPKDIDCLNAKYIFCSVPSVQKTSGMFYVVNNEAYLTELYEDYKTKYMS